MALAVAIVGTLLAAAKGVVGATTVTMGLIVLPTMLRHGYDKKLAAGTMMLASRRNRLSALAGLDGGLFAGAAGQGETGGEQNERNNECNYCLRRTCRRRLRRCRTSPCAPLGRPARWL